MKVILQQDVRGQGKKGQLVEVSDGYGRNYLLPRKLAIEATAENLNTMKMQDKAKAARLALSEQLKNCPVRVKARAGQGGKLFGAITSQQISDALKEQYNIDISKSQLILGDPIKAFGSYEIKAKLGNEISGTVYLMVTEEK